MTSDDFKRGDRVTCEQRPGVLGVVVSSREATGVGVKWDAYGHVAIEYHDPSHLTLWRQA